MATVKLTVDGVPVEVEAGSTVLKAAEKAGINIPTLCYLEGIHEVGACRVCVVDVGAKALQAACVAPVAEGMKVLTNTPAVRTARKTTVELILSNHPDNCPSCVRNLNCELQALAESLNIRGNRFEGAQILASIEGERGMPRPRPPFPAQKGLWGCPTCINNVETFANVAAIILNGAAWFASMGTEKSKGSKVFALAGQIVNTGLAEVPMGITLREIVYDIAGGILGGKQFKAVQIGGPSGGCLPASLLDTPVDYDSLTQAGAIMGSGGMIVVDEATCMVDLARYFLTFVQAESCGKCPPCRVGTKRMHEILERICAGEGQEGDVERLQELGTRVKQLSLCGLGQTAPNPVLSTIRYFREEYDAHIREGRCPAMACSALVDYTVVPEKSTGCTACVKVCPSGAITGERKKPHLIDHDKCIRCGSCETACKFDAIVKTERGARGEREVAD